MKEVKHSSKWKDKPCSWIWILILLKCPYNPNQTIDLMQILSKYNDIFHRSRIILEFLCNGKMLWITKAILQKNKGGGTMLPDFRL